MQNKFIFVLLSIVVLGGGILRFVKLTSLPASLNWDEVSHAYTAYSLYHTGRDQWGKVLPLLNFRAYGDYPAALNVYFTVPVIAVLGPSDLAARLPHALAGMLVIGTAFGAAYRWTGNKYAALAAAFFVSWDPWTLFPSRAVFQSNWAVLSLSLAAAYLPVRSVWAGVFLGLSLFAYHNTRIFVPIFAVALVFLSPSRRLMNLSLFLLACLVLFFPASRVRTGQVGILDAGSIARIEMLRNTSSFHPFIKRLIYNRPVYFVSRAAVNYLDYFSVAFLFKSGGTQYQFSQPGFGVLSLVQVPFFYSGLAVLMWLARKDSKYRYLLLWVLLAPLPATVTRDKFAVIRATTMLPVVQIVSSLAIAGVFARVSRPVRNLAILTVMVLGVTLQISYFRNYFNSYNQTYSRSWQYGYRQAVDYLRAHSGEYNRAVITKRYGEPHEFLLWYWPWRPQAYQKDPLLIWDYHADWYWVDGFSNFSFVNDWELPEKSLHFSSPTLVVSSPDNPPLRGEKVSTINFVDGTPAFIISRI